MAFDNEAFVERRKLAGTVRGVTAGLVLEVATLAGREVEQPVKT